MNLLCAIVVCVRGVQSGPILAAAIARSLATRGVSFGCDFDALCTAS
jgi:hypothetical protein